VQEQGLAEAGIAKQRHHTLVLMQAVDEGG
jgi:hypothetical protein